MKHYVMKAYNKIVWPELYRYPIVVQRKYDGIRCIMQRRADGTREFVTAQGKKIPNVEANTWLQENVLDKTDNLVLLDGELTCVGSTFHETQSILMSYDKSCRNTLRYTVFDEVSVPENQYIMRRLSYREALLACPQHLISEAAGPQLAFEDAQSYINWKSDPVTTAETAQWEGFIVRWLYGPYKFGRTTLREGFMFKDCEYVREEATVVRVNIRQDWKTFPSIGSFTVTHSKYGEFDIGSGFSLDQAISFWNVRESLIGKRITFKYKPFGQKDKPRSPIFVGFRYD